MGVQARVGLVSAVVFLTASCAGLRVGHDYDREMSFAGASTYDWVETPDELEDVERINPFIDRRMRRAVDAELEARGFLRAADGPVDLLVAVSVLGVEDGDRGRRGRTSPAFLVGLGFGFGHYPGLWYPWGAYAPFYSPYYPPFHGPWGYRGFRRFGFGLGVSPYFGYPYGYRAYGPYGAYGGYPDRGLELAPGSFVVDVMDGESGELWWRGWADGALGFAPDEEDLPEFIASVVHRIMERFPPERDAG